MFLIHIKLICLSHKQNLFLLCHPNEIVSPVPKMVFSINFINDKIYFSKKKHFLNFFFFIITSYEYRQADSFFPPVQRFLSFNLTWRSSRILISFQTVFSFFGNKNCHNFWTIHFLSLFNINKGMTTVLLSNSDNCLKKNLHDSLNFIFYIKLYIKRDGILNKINS